LILLDTNVISEVIRAAPDPNVARWMRTTPRSTLVTSAVVQAEILYGLEVMPDGARRRERVALAQAVFAEIEVILPLTPEAASAYAELAARRRAAGRPLSGFDGLIAASAKAEGAAIATRDTGDFQGCGIDLINPWEAP
jgi:hypothetical protein